MSNKNLLSGRDKELQELAEQYELAMSAKQPFYLDADDLADLADWYGTKKNYDKALEIAEYGLKLHPDSTALMIEYAYLHLDSGKRAKAREIIENLPDTYSPEAKVVRAHLLLSEGKLDDAEQLLDTIEDKEDLANVVDVSYMYLDMGYPDKALAWLNPVKEEYADEEAYIAVVADCYYGKGMIEEAIPLYNQLIDIYIIEANTKSENVISLIFSTFVPRLSFSVASRDKILSLDVILRLFSIKSVKIADI